MTAFIDLHVHPPVPAVIEGIFAPYIPSLERTFRRQFPVMTAEQIADYYRALDGRAVLLGWDAETATGLAPFGNRAVAEIVHAHPDVFFGFGSVDPHKGAAAVLGVREAAKAGLIGLKFHPSAQRFDPADESVFPIYEEAEAHGLTLLFHTGVTALGAGMPGGAGIRHRFAHPVHLDDVASYFPALKIVMAHPATPWQSEAIAFAVHKPNLYLELSGWSPRHFDDELLSAIRGPLRDRVLFGTDFPFITPDRWLKAWRAHDMDADVSQAVLVGNARRLLGLQDP